MLPQILEAFAADDSTFVQNCARLMAMSGDMTTMWHFEFCATCDTKLESIRQRIDHYRQVPAPHGVSSRGSWAHRLSQPMITGAVRAHCGLSVSPSPPHAVL